MRHPTWFGGDTATNYWGDRTDGILNTVGNVTHSSTLDGDFVVKQYSQLTINTGHIMSVSNRCKGLWIYVNGDCTINGTISMTARGAAAATDSVGESPNYGSSLINNLVDVTVSYVTVTTASNHNLSVNDWVEVNVPGTEGAFISGYHQVTATPSATQFRYVPNAGSGSSSVVSTWKWPQTFNNPNAGTTKAVSNTGGVKIRRFAGSGSDVYSSASSTAFAGCGSALIASENNQRVLAGNGKVWTFSRYSNMFIPGSQILRAGRGGGLFYGFNAFGGFGTPFSGGAGCGGAVAAHGAQNGGAGGSGSHGGAGNPKGTGNQTDDGGNLVIAPEDGTGGTIVLLVRGNLTIGASGKIEANGMRGGGMTATRPTSSFGGGGGSGGGNILVLHAGTLTNNGVIQVNGGVGGVDDDDAQAEGGYAGTSIISQILV